MERLGKLTSGDLLTSGIYPSMEGDAAPLWTDGENIIFDNQGVRKNYGLLGLGNLANEPSGFRTTYASSEPRAYVGGGTEAHMYRNADGFTKIAEFSAPNGQFQFEPWDTWVLINNQANPLKLWKNTGLAAAITAPFSQANVIFVYGYRAFAIEGNVVNWCSFNNIEDWTPTLLNSAGNLPLRALAGDAICAKPIGDSIGIYSRINAGLFTALGGTLGYGFRRPIKGVKAVSSNSVVSIGDRHYGLTQDNCFVTDLISFQYIDEASVRGYIKENINLSRLSEVYGWPDLANSMVRWTIPVGETGYKGLGYRFDRGTWTRFNDDVRMGEEAGAFDYSLMLNSTRLLRQDKTTFNNDLDPMTSFIQTKPMDFGDRNRGKRIQRLSFDGSFSGAQVQIGYSDTPDATPTWTTAKQVEANVFTEDANTQVEGLFISLKIATTALDANWSLAGGEIYGEWTYSGS